MASASARLGPRQMTAEAFAAQQWPPLRELLWQLLIDPPAEPSLPANAAGAAPLRQADVHSVIHDSVMAGHGAALHDRLIDMLEEFCRLFRVPLLVEAAGQGPVALLSALHQLFGEFTVRTDRLKPVLHYFIFGYIERKLQSTWTAELDVVLSNAVLNQPVIRESLPPALAAAATTTMLVEPQLLLDIVTTLHRVAPKYLDDRLDLRRRFLAQGPMYDDDPSSTVVQAAQLAQAQLQQAQQAAAANGKDMQNSVDKRPLSDHDTDDDADGGDRPTKVKQTSVRAQMTTSVSR